MKRFRPALLLLCRLLVGGLFLYAGISKALDPRAFAGEVAAYRLFPYSLNLLVAATLPWVEIVAAGFLLSGRKLPAAALLLLVLELNFAVVLILALVRGLTISCGCFGAAGGSSLLWALGRDLLLIAMTLPFCCSERDRERSDD